MLFSSKSQTLTFIAISGLIFSLSTSLPAIAATNTEPSATSSAPIFDEALHTLEIHWGKAKFTMPEGRGLTREMEKIGTEADALLKRYPDRVEAIDWDGILLSERASMATNPFTALSLAKRAKAMLERAYAINPLALSAAAATSLGVLYYRVPGFPIAFGDKTKARALLEQATQGAPNGLDAWYFYGDFLTTQGDYAKARQVLEHALTIPADPNRPFWDKGRRVVVRALLAKIASKN